jgi:hypothetical protein
MGKSIENQEQEIDPFIKTSHLARTNREIQDREGRPGDIVEYDAEADQADGYVGHGRGGADIRFVSKKQQERRRLAEQRQKESMLAELPRAFIAELRKNDSLVITAATLQKIAADVPHDFNKSDEANLAPRLAQIIIKGLPRLSSSLPRRSKAAVEERIGQPGTYFMCYITPEGDIHKTLLDSANVPGFKEKLGTPITETEVKALGLQTIGRWYWNWHFTDMFTELTPNYLPNYSVISGVKKLTEVLNAGNCTLESLCAYLEQIK